MKLDTLIQENTIDHFDNSKLMLNDAFSEIEKQNVKTIISKFSKFSKNFQLDLDTQNEFNFTMSNGLADFEFTFFGEDSGTSNNPEIYFGLSLNVNESYIFNNARSNDQESRVIGNNSTGLMPLSSAFFNRALKYCDNMLKIASEFTLWYFKLSSKCGKIKLVKTRENLVDGSSNGTRRWVPYAGEFSVTDINSKNDPNIISEIV